MAKYLVTSGSYFEPFTYDELSRPIAQAVEAHNATQDTYDQLSMETSALGRYITDNPGDVNAKRLYDSYLSKLDALQDNLWRNGYNASTRRDLSAARSGYAGDIARLQAAIKTRQERSKEYWDAKHKNPDLVTGDDPGLSGLDAYLADDTYGQNYFTYSGKSFADEVGAEIKAMGNEMLRNPEISRNPELVGYLQQKLSEGFSNEERNNAMSFVRGILNAKKDGMSTEQVLNLAQGALDAGGEGLGLSVAERLLAGALVSRLRSTGAAGKVSDSEFNRLVDYGGIGMAQGVGKSTITNLHDLVWAENQKTAQENLRHQHAMEEAAAKNSGDGSGLDAGIGYEIPSFYLRTQGTDADRKTKLYGDYFGKVSKKNPLHIKVNGKWVDLDSPEKATNYLYNNEFRTGAFNEYGLDTLKPATKKQESRIAYEYPDGTTQEFNIRTKHDTGDRVIVEVQQPNGKWVRWDEATDNFNRYRQNDKAYREKIEKENGIKFSDYDNDVKDEKKFRSEFGIDDPRGELREYYRSIAEIKTSLGTEKPAMLVGPNNPSTLNAYSNEIANAYYSNMPTNKKDNHFAFYRLGADNRLNDKEKVKFNDVFELNDNGAIKDGSLMSIWGLPSLITKGPGYLIITTNKGKFAMDAHMLDTALGSVIYGSERNPLGLAGAVDLLYSPFENPEDTFRMTEDEDRDFTDFTMSVFDGNYHKGAYKANTKKMMNDPDARADYYGSIVNLMHASFSQPREVLELLNMQTRGNSSAKAQPMFPRQ